MISESRARAIDYYLNYDFRARRRCFFITSGIGLIAIIACLSLSLPETTAMLASFVAMVAAFLLYLAGYRSREGISLQGDFKRRTLAKLWESNPIFPSRRRAVFGIPAFAAALLCLVFIPNPTDAQVVNDRIRRLLRAGRVREAQAFAQKATDANIPLAPDTARVFGSPIVLGSNTPFDTWLRRPYDGPRLVPVKLASGEVLTILVPVVYIPSGRSRIAEPIQPMRASLTGDGPAGTYVGIDFRGADKSSAVLPYKAEAPEPSADVLIYGMTFECWNVGEKCEAALVSVEPGASKIAVTNFILDSICQCLDRVIWEDVQFRNCTVTCGGDRFQLIDVSFVDCNFSIASEIPASLRSRFAESAGKPISMKFSPNRPS